MACYGCDNMKPVINNETGVPDRLICIHCFVYIYFFNHTCCDAIYAKDLFSLSYLNTSFPGMILSIGAANERRRYNCTGWANTQKDPCVPLKKVLKSSTRSHRRLYPPLPPEGLVVLSAVSPSARLSILDVDARPLSGCTTDNISCTWEEVLCSWLTCDEILTTGKNEQL